MLPVCRELWEESGLIVDDLKQAGILKFEFLNEPEIMEVHVFTSNKFEGTPTESEGKDGATTNSLCCSLSIVVLSGTSSNSCHPTPSPVPEQVCFSKVNL